MVYVAAEVVCVSSVSFAPCSYVLTGFLTPVLSVLSETVKARLRKK